MQRLEQAVRARLRAVLAPGLEPCVRAVLEQRLEEAALDLLELFQRSLDPDASSMPLNAAEKQRRYRARRDADPERRAKYLEWEQKKWMRDKEQGKKKGIDECSKREQRAQRKKWREAQKKSRKRFGLKQEVYQVKEEQETGGGATHSDFVVCVKTEEEELDIKPFSDCLRYCPRCGSTLQRPPTRPPLPTQPRCSVCGQSFSRDALLLEHNYGRHPGQMLIETPETMTQNHSATESMSSLGSRCSICGQDFIVVSRLLEHMSEHLRAPQNNHLQGLRNYSANLDYSDGDEAELDGDGSDSTGSSGSSGSSSLDTSGPDSGDSSDSGDSAESGDNGGLEEDPQDTGDMDCAFCGRVFRSSEMLEKHIQKHIP